MGACPSEPPWQSARAHEHREGDPGLQRGPSLQSVLASGLPKPSQMPKEILVRKTLGNSDPRQWGSELEVQFPEPLSYRDIDRSVIFGDSLPTCYLGFTHLQNGENGFLEEYVFAFFLIKVVCVHYEKCRVYRRLKEEIKRTCKTPTG